MRRMVICAVLLLAMLITGVSLYIYTEDVASDVASELLELEDLSRRTPPETLAERAAGISAKWEEFCRVNIFLTNNECAFEVSEALARIASEAAAGEDDITEDCHMAQMLVDIYCKSRSFTLENIF